MPPPSPVCVMSSRAVKPPPRPRERIPLTSWDVAVISAHYIQTGGTGLLFALPLLLTGAAGIVSHLADAVADALAGDYYPVAGRFMTDHHRDDRGDVVGCSVSIDCDGQGVQIIHAVADGVAVADVIPPDVDVPSVVEDFFPLNDAVNYDGHELPLFLVQVTELVDGVFLGFVCSHALADGTTFWNFLNMLAEIARARLAPPGARHSLTSSRRPLFDRWSPDGGTAGPVVLPCADLSELIERTTRRPLRGRVLHFSAESLAALKEQTRQELLAAGDAAGAAALTRFQALSSLMWRCVTRAQRLAPDHETAFHVAVNNRGRLRPALPAEYFGNCIYAISTEPLRASELLARGGGHGRAAAAVGRAVAAHTDASIRARLSAWMANPVISARLSMMGGSPWFDAYRCDFGWGKPVAVRSGRANKADGRTVLYPGREGGGSVDAEVTLAPEHMAALELDDELWAAVSSRAGGGLAGSIEAGGRAC